MQPARRPPPPEAAPPSGGAPALSEGALAVAAGLRRASLAPAAVAGVGAGLDAAAAAIGTWGGLALAGEAPLRAAAAAVAVGLAVVAAVALSGGYRLARLRRFARGALAPASLAAAGAWLAGGGAPGAALAAGLALPARGLGAAIAGAALDFGLTERRAALVGGGARGVAAMEALAAAGADIRICGVFDDRDDSRSPAAIRGVPKLGTVADLVGFVRAAEIDMLVVTLPLAAERRIREVLKAVEVLPVDVRLWDFAGDPSLPRRAGAAPAGGLVALMSRPLRAPQRLAKRALDVVGAAVALVLLAPAMLATAAAIRLDTPGPALFRQQRHGYNHRPVEVWKFRSMRAEDCDPAARNVVTEGDPRVTRVGRFIRRWSIDELPQLLNVLTGDLSLVGPRPHVVGAVSARQEAFEAIVDGYAARHKVRPGITGWAQIHGARGGIEDPAALRRRVELDLFYIENWSLWLDLRILAATPFRLADSAGAY
ncbi:exopolysaccharide biosynthesis polyprenyl glycosylphosphotransferase [Amaricoccus sp.]|uniref:exopolysaccharide biosynthesis polyprenyl glycosylphosphotransferase n=1 Tax=Amaricoccus sp. TaxID=1872485 RepID=UPI001B3D69DD|nr:exopolysaccharide biosynthesis polyprenyl glycosylphosphotransferase [Amaricoccus sp.]MBP7003227.1 exopolysaccharide biosynthesis polyprenyl glycosylphosphotransferase [Amaricoccus sp.]